MLVVGHWSVFMSKTDQFWQYAARYLVSSSPDTNSYSDQRSSCSHTGANTRGGDPRFKPAQYRAKAGEYGELANIRGLEQRRAFRELEQRFAVLAHNEQWLADNYQT